MNILVTGGAGFIGSNFVLYFLKKYPEYKIVNLDNLTYAADLDYLKEVEDNLNYTFIKGDIADKKTVEDIFEEKKINAVINFAAESHVDRSVIDSAPFIHSNVMGTQVLLDIAKKYGVQKFHQISTDEVYGQVDLGDERMFKETDALDPRSPYSASKAAADLLVLSYFITHNFPAVITRCSNNFGPHQCMEKFIPTCIRSILENKPIPLYGDGKYVRDWLHVEDHCKAVDIVFHTGKNGEIYNIGADNEWTNIDIAKMLIEKMGASESLMSFVKDRPGHDRRYSIDSSKIQSELDWKPEKDFDKGIDETVKWFQEKI